MVPMLQQCTTQAQLGNLLPATASKPLFWGKLFLSWCLWPASDRGSWIASHILETTAERTESCFGLGNLFFAPYGVQRAARFPTKGKLVSEKKNNFWSLFCLSHPRFTKSSDLKWDASQSKLYFFVSQYKVQARWTKCHRLLWFLWKLTSNTKYLWPNYPTSF